MMMMMIEKTILVPLPPEIKPVQLHNAHWHIQCTTKREQTQEIQT